MFCLLQFYLSIVETSEEKSLVEFLYKEYKQLMYKTAMSILHNPQLSEDAVHDAFIRVIKNSPKFRSYSCNENVSYLVIIVRGISLNMLKQTNRTTELEDDVPSTEDIEATAEIRISYENVLKNVQKLTPALKNAATLYYGHRLTEKEIAEMLDMNINTVRVSLMRARKLLRNMSEEVYYE